MGLTVFSIPKPFAGHVGLIQTNAVESWKRLDDTEVILFGADAGVADAAARAGVRHEPEIVRNAVGTPLVSDAFERARHLARHDYLVYINADIVLMSDFVRAVTALAEGPFPTWVMVGQRHDLDVREPIAMVNGWERKLQDDVEAKGSLHGKSGIDFFAFPKTLPIHLPPLAVGRVGWDSWLIYATRRAGIPLVDATRVVHTVHQNHAPAYDPAGAEADDNRIAAGGYHHMGSLRDADWRLTVDASGRLGVVSRWMGKIWFSPPFRAGLALKRGLSRRLTGSRI